MSSPTLPANVKVLSISELTNAVRGVLEECFTPVWVAGEVSNLRISAVSEGAEPRNPRDVEGRKHPVEPAADGT